MGCGLTKVEEELGEDVASKETVRANLVVTETHDAEDDGEQDETHELDGLATDGVDKRNSDPVTGDGTSTDDDDVTNGSAVENLVHVGATAVANSGENDRAVETETVVGNVEEEPRTSGTEKDFAVLPGAVVGHEVGPGRLGDLEVVGGVADGLGTNDLVGDTLVLVVHVGLDVRAGLNDISRHIEGVTGSLGNGETIVEGDAARDGTETDNHTPHLVNGKTTDTTALGDSGGGLKGLLETRGDNQGDDTSGELTETLHGEDRAHHGASPLGCGELGGDDGGQRVVTTDADAHEDTPEDQDTGDGESRRGGGKDLGKRGEDDEDELETVHLLTTDNIGKETKTELTNDGTGRGCDLDGSVRVGRDGAGLRLGVVPVDDTQHCGDQTDGEDVVGISEETDTGDHDGADVVPAKGGLVDLGESKPSALIWVRDMSIVVVEVVEGSVTARCSVSHDWRCVCVCDVCPWIGQVEERLYSR